jgi:GAF domain-containing protein
MPGLSGFDLLAALKGDQRTKNIAVILVTAHHRNSNMISQGLNLGADDYIARPFLRDEFMSRVEATIRVRKAEVETQRQARMVARRNKRLQWVNELALAVNSSLNLQEIFPTFLPKLAQLLQVELISIILLNEEKRKINVYISLPAGQHVSASLGFDSTTRKLQKHIPAIILQVLKSYSLHDEINFSPDIKDIQFTPMVSKDHLVGAIAFAGKHQVALSDDQTLLQSAAGIIAVAVENARLLESTQQQVDDLIALNEIGRALTSTLDLDQILQQTTQLMHRSLQSETASLWLLDETNEQLALITSSGVGSNASSGNHIGVRKGIAGYVVQTGEPFISGDITRDEHQFEGPVKAATSRPPRSEASESLVVGRDSPPRLIRGSLPRSSRTRRSAVFLPTPGTFDRRPLSSASMTSDSSSAGKTLSTEIARRGPTLGTETS